MAKANVIKVGLPLYGQINPLFFQHWLEFQGELAKESKGHSAGLMTTHMPYVDTAENTIVDQSLRCKCGHVWSLHLARGDCKYLNRLDGSPPCGCQKLEAAEEWDYLVMVEHDNILPTGWIKRVVEEYDKPIVGLMYFGKVEEDQRPIPGWLKNGEYHRLEFETVMEWIDKPGFYEVDTVGMGATAIRRDVFENWNPWMMPWFQTKLSPPNQILGQDIYFCMAAKKQGFPIYVDTAFTAEHIGYWRSNLANYIAANQWHKVREVEMAKAQPQVSERAAPELHVVAKPPESNGKLEHTQRFVDILVPPLE